MISSVLGSIRKGDYMFSIYLKDTCIWTPNLIFWLCSEERFISPSLSTLVFLQLLRYLLECFLWYQSGLARRGFDSCTIWTIGWWLWSLFFFCFNIASSSFGCARTWALSSTWRSQTSNLPARLSIFECWLIPFERESSQKTLVLSYFRNWQTSPLLSLLLMPRCGSSCWAIHGFLGVVRS